MPIHEFEAAVKWKEKQKITWRDVINTVVKTSLIKETTVKMVTHDMKKVNK